MGGASNRSRELSDVEATFIKPPTGDAYHSDAEVACVQVVISRSSSAWF